MALVMVLALAPGTTWAVNEAPLPQHAPDALAKPVPNALPNALANALPIAALPTSSQAMLHNALSSAVQSSEPTDAILHLLQQKGLLRDAASSPLVQQVRDKASDMVLSAMQFLGVPYRRGGSSADEGFDCSGFTRYVFENSIGLVLPRRADEQAKLDALDEVRREELKPGDLVFFNTMRKAFSHVGIYIGEGKFIHSPRSGGNVRIEDMRQAYWSQRFNGARRALPAQAAAEEPASR